MERNKKKRSLTSQSLKIKGKKENTYDQIHEKRSKQINHKKGEIKII